MVGPTKTDNSNSGYLIVVDVAVVAPTTAADDRLKFENLVLYEDEESGDTHMAMYITTNILTQRLANTSWHSPPFGTYLLSEQAWRCYDESSGTRRESG
jgi:hypothetical protein